MPQRTVIREENVHNDTKNLVTVEKEVSVSIIACERIARAVAARATIKSSQGQTEFER